MLARHIPIAALAVCTLVSCNKDELIEIDNPDSDSHFRPATEQSKATCSRVYEWTPAPGQFINEWPAADTAPSTPAEAAEWARKRLDEGKFVSLGGFGGYIVVGFDHSIKATASDYELGVAGNAFLNASNGKGGSNEPGIVYVMQDSNGNGLPDDVWYELRGSEYGRMGSDSDYAVTYYRPSAPGMDVKWTDSDGQEGTVDYLGTFHSQDYYYPSWIESDSYTLKGTRLSARNEQDATTGMWDNSAYGYGYADNMGSDNAQVAGFSQCNRFRISDAVTADGKPAGLRHIDFVKIQTGVNAKSGWLGEVSTEVLGVVDLTL